MALIIIPAKYQSSRLPNKNFLPFYGGLSLLQISVLRSVKAEVGRVVVSTDNSSLALKQISDIGCKSVNVIARPEHLSKDPSTILDVLKHSIEWVNEPYDSVISVLPTSPFNTAEHIRKAFSLYNEKAADKLISVSESSKPPYNAWLLENEYLLSAFEGNKYQSVQSTRCPTTYHSNGCVGVYNVGSIMGQFKPKRPIGYKMKMSCSVDIDHLFEFQMAQSVFYNFAEDIDILAPYFRSNHE
jgi:CMP-N,N'-diacetyllegionaminic acid synthase